MQKISKALDDITTPIFSKNGFIDQKLIKFWPVIVGESLAQFTTPEKIAFSGSRTRQGVLHIAISNPALALEIQSQEGRIVEKISTYFGYQAVSRIRLVMEKNAGKKISNDNKVTRTKITQSDKENIKQSLKCIDDKELAAVLTSMLSSMFEDY